MTALVMRTDTVIQMVLGDRKEDIVIMKETAMEYLSLYEIENLDERELGTIVMNSKFIFIKMANQNWLVLQKGF